MDKITYLAELAEGLARWVPERERQDILRYYAEYFEEAGADREAQVIQELGDPWALSCRLAVEGGYVTQEQAASWTPPKKRRKWPWVLGAAVVVLVVAGISAAAWMGSIAFHLVRQTAYTDSVPVPSVEVIDRGEFSASYDDPGFGGAYVVEQTPPPNSTVEEESIGGFWNAEDGYLEAFGSVDAEISLGNIFVGSGEDFTVSIQQGTSLSSYRVKWEIKDGVLKIQDDKATNQVQINNWSDLKNLFTGNISNMDVIITVPEGCQMDKVSVKTDLGNIFLSDLSVGTKVEAETSMGNVDCYEVRTGGKIDLNTSMGNVNLGIEELWSGVDIDLETSMGNVDASLGCVEGECSYELKTEMGSVSVNGNDQGNNLKVQHKLGDTSYKLDAESDMGDVAVFFCDDRW